MTDKDTGNALSAWQKDPRVATATKMLLEALEDKQKRITGVKPADPEKKQSYDDLLRAFAEARGAPLWHPYIGSGLGKGALVELLDGSVKYDLICGIGPHYFGHSHPLYIEACAEAAINDIVMQGHLQQNADSLLLMQLLLKHSGMDHCFLASSGVMANENGLKIAFQNRFPANRILAFERCFMGRTLAASQITDKAQFREGLPETLFVDYLPFYNHLDPEGSLRHTLHTLQNHLRRRPKQYAVMCFELVQGEGGFYYGTREYYRAIMEVLRKENILVLVDEVQSFGRLPKLFAMQYFGVDDLVDIVTLGKLSQVCATLYRKELVPRPGLLSQTFISSTSAIKTALAIITSLTTGGFYGDNGRVEQLHSRFEEILQRLSNKHPDLLEGPFGIGAMIAFTVYKGANEKTTAFVKALFHAGIICFTAGTSPTRVRFLPPIGVLAESDFIRIESIIEEVLLATA